MADKCALYPPIQLEIYHLLRSEGAIEKTWMSQKEAHIVGTGTAFPYPVSIERYWEVDAKMRSIHKVPETTILTLKALSQGSRIRFHHTVCPHWLPENKSSTDYPDIQDAVLQEDIFTPYDYTPPFWKRMSVFKGILAKLGTKAAHNAIADWGGNSQDITHIFTTCTSGWTEPGLPGILIIGESPCSGCETGHPSPPFALRSGDYW